MEVVKDYQVGAEELFGMLSKAFVTDFHANTNRRIKAEDIKMGLQYKKNFGQDGKQSVLVEVDTMTFPSHYKVNLISNRGTNVIEYVIEPKGEKAVTCLYREEYIETDTFTKWNNKLLMPFFRKKVQRHMLMRLDNIVKETKERVAG